MIEAVSQNRKLEVVICTKEHLSVEHLFFGLVFADMRTGDPKHFVESEVFFLITPGEVLRRSDDVDKMTLQSHVG